LNSTSKNQLFKKGSGNPGGHESERERAVCPLGKDSQQHPGLHLEDSSKGYQWQDRRKQAQSRIQEYPGRLKKVAKHWNRLPLEV